MRTLYQVLSSYLLFFEIGIIIIGSARILLTCECLSLKYTNFYLVVYTFVIIKDDEIIKEDVDQKMLLSN